MHKKLRNMAALAALCALPLTVQAQTDVTSTYLTNADFSSGTTVSSNVYGYQADAQKETGAVYWAQAVDGWTISSEQANGRGGGLFAYGSSYQLKGGGVTAPSTNPDNDASGNALGIFSVWNASIQYTQEAKTNLPAGKYTLSYTYYNPGSNKAATNLIGFKESGGTTHYMTNTTFVQNKWTTESITFTLAEETSGTFSIGLTYSGGSGNNGAPMVFVDNMKLTYTADLDLTEYNSLIEKAKTVIETYKDYTGTNTTPAKTTLQGLIDATAPTTYATLQTAVSNLKAAIEAVPQAVYVDGYNTVKSTYTIDQTDLIGSAISGWGSTGNAFVNNNGNQHWSGAATTTYYESNDWSSSSWKRNATKTVTLPAGKYVLLASGRASADVTVTMGVTVDETTTTETITSKGATGKGIDTDGNATYSSEATYANSNNGYGWEWHYVEFTLTESKSVTFNFDAAASAKQNWVSVCDVQLLSSEDTYKQAIVAAYNNAKTNYPQDITALVNKDLSTWTTSNFSNTMSSQHWDGTSTTTYYEMKDGYASSEAWTTSATKEVTLPAGKYALVASGRSSASATLTMSAAGQSVTFSHNGDTGKGIDTNGAATYEESATYANDNKGRGWEWRVVEFELSAEQKVTLAFNGSCDGVQYQYLSYSNVSLLTTSDNTVCYDKLQTAISTAEALNTTVNVGTDVFQIPSAEATKVTDAITEAKKLAKTNTNDELVAGTEKLNGVITAYNNVELNAPSEGDLFNITITGNDDYDYNGKTVTVKYNSSAQGNYDMGYTEDAGSYYNQAFTFTKTDNVNEYLLSVDVDGTTQYVCTGLVYDNSQTWYSTRLRLTPDKANAVAIKVEPTATSGILHLRNTVSTGLIGANGKTDTGFYTSNKLSNFSVTAAKKVSANLKMTTAHWATFIAPFSVTKPEGVAAYTAAATSNNKYVVLTESKEATLAANTPYILYAESATCDNTVEGYSTASKSAYTEGLLTGVMEKVTVAKNANNYVLQNQTANGVAFYIVNKDDTYCIANRAYLTAPESSSAKSFGFTFDDETTGISAAEAVPSVGVETARYNVAGARLAKPAKGLNIVKLSDGRMVKVMVK